MSLIDLCENGVVPDVLTRYGIRQLCQQRLIDENVQDIEKADQRFRTMLDDLRQSPIAIETAAANEQHYEVPTRFFQLCLGKRLKYSSCFYKTGNETLDEAEVAMLSIYSERAELADGQHILELGCGWGSLTLWMDANQFDRVVSVEMFEHMRNYQTLLSRISKWMKQDAKLFVHIFCHRYVMYPFETEGDNNWMGQYFFTGGIMPSADTLLHFQQDLSMQQRWLVSGEHYEKTSNHWLSNQDAHHDEIMQIMKTTYGEKDAKRWFNRWRIFWLSCAELFGLEDGNEWLVAHYLFNKR